MEAADHPDFRTALPQLRLACAVAVTVVALVQLERMALRLIACRQPGHELERVRIRPGRR